MSSAEEVLALARNYVSWDIDSVTASAVQELIDQNDVAKLTPMMTKRIQFGTAGLRAAMGPGYDKMNDLVILQTSQGLVRYLEANVTDAREKVNFLSFRIHYTSLRFYLFVYEGSRNWI